MKKIILYFVLLFPVLGLSANPPTYVPDFEDSPDIGKEISVYLGDRMLGQRFGYYEDCLSPNINFSAKKVGAYYHIVKGGLLCDPIGEKNFYLPDHVNVIAAKSSNPYKMKVDIKEKRGKVSYKINGYTIKTFSKEEFDQSFSETVRYVIEARSLQKTIEYSGKSGSTLKFIYSEFEDNMARDAFTREFQVDLNEGNIGAYKGSVFEIIEATNSSIKYKVIRHFPWN